MKEIKIDTYDTFTCIADQCSFTCCQEWKIGVDDETINRWDKLENDAKEHLLCHVEENEGCKIIKLNEKKQCPHLRSDKLCSLVAQYGEDCISETCRTFPREIHDFGNRKEYALVACCPEVIDMLNQNKQIALIGEELTYEEDVLYAVRKLIMDILNDTSITIEEGFMVGFYILLGLMEQEELSLSSIKSYQDKKVIKELVKTIQDMEFNSLDTFDERNELFLDISDNYRKQNYYKNYIEIMGQEAEHLLEGYDQDELESLIIKFEEQMKPYQTLMRNYAISEVYNTMLIPESDYDSMVVMMQWIGLEYAVMRHAMFLKWKKEGCGNLEYETVRNSIVVIARMTGYDQEDIFDYLENSFQEIIWEWGYFALVTGNGR